jgi:predicted Zn-dependent protease
MPNRSFTPQCVVLLLLPVLVASSTGCSFLRPSDQNVIGQANQVHGSLEPAVIRDAEVQRYMDSIGNRILDGAVAYDREKGHSKEKGLDNSWMNDVKFHLVNSQTLNAFTTGGQHIYIYNQLFQDAKSEDELAAVMAHEFAHVYARHVHSGMERQYGVMAAALGGAALGYAAGGSESGGQYAAVGSGAGGALAQFFSKGYTRADENEADKLGFSFYIRAGWDPERFADFFKQMIEKGYDKTPEITSDHPSLANRVTETEARVERMSPEARRWRREPIADRREFESLQRAAIEAARDLPSDKTLAAAQLMLASFPSCVTPEDQPEQKKAQQELLRAVEAPPAQRKRAAR